MNRSLIEDLGGRPLLEKIMKEFYNKIYDHPWIGLYFKHVEQEVIEKQQVDFMIGALGGDKSLYSGRLPVQAHKNMFVTQELFEIRESILLDCLKKENAPEELIERWMKIDNAFKSSIVKKKVEDCEKTFATEEIIAFSIDGKKIA